ncbi:hypothetical protein OIU84_018025 [Salix udensis]|uniref:Uncharacterized protein n=1 Tax=Salix udensis TaxID=889485 RepID=A0AAD6PN42_9ROSI|nr:hypothetical protein OIU84_018025 [Salix udensis]
MRPEKIAGHGEDYQVQLAVGQCPRSCIHYVTPSQRVILEEFLDSISCVAVKVPNEDNRQSFKSLKRGVPNSVLETRNTHLYPSESEGENCRLTLKERLGIAMHIADDLEYLHCLVIFLQNMERVLEYNLEEMYIASASCSLN